MTAEPTSLADQALANLVNQFARPLDFLRELAQNSIDAGSPRVEVSVAFDPPKTGEELGVLRIGVDDWGEGMNEEIIDGQLTRLFSSSKEDDMTKIGKFGIGFTSIFAIQPEAILLRTGRHGEFWELLFHSDRSFDKIRVQTPVDGTKITLFKRTAPEDVARFVADARNILDYWCEHSSTPILFWDRTGGDDVAAPDTDDPFAAFAGAPARSAPPRSGPLRVDRPLALEEAPLSVRHVEDDVEVVLGYTERPRYGFYNGGLTLLSTGNAEILGPYADRLAHLSFKVKHDRLEHTLTRDNVLHDENWERAMAVVVKARAELQAALVARLETEVASGSAVAPWHARLATECRAPGGDVLRRSLATRALFVDHLGRPVTLAKIGEQERAVGSVLLGTGRTALNDELDRLGILLVADTPDTRRLLLATDDPPLFSFFRNKRKLDRGEDVFVMPAPVAEAELPPEERRLLHRTREVLRSAVGLRLEVPVAGLLRFEPSESSIANRLALLVGDFAGSEGSATPGASGPVLALNGPKDGRVFQRKGRGLVRLPAFLRWRTLLLNRNHPLFRAQVLAGGEDLDLAAFGLAQALLHAEDIEPERSYRQMLDAMTSTPARTS